MLVEFGQRLRLVLRGTPVLRERLALKDLKDHKALKA
jgi:hypothetical protein